MLDCSPRLRWCQCLSLGGPIGSAGLGVTAGIACFATPPDDPRAILDAADRALYDAKTTAKGGLVVIQGKRT